MIFDSVYLLALTAWLGSIVFFSFAIAPLIFQVLDSESAGRFLRAFFPRYYVWGAVSGALALPCAVGVPLAFPEHRGPWVGLQAMVIIVAILMTLYAVNSLTPAINAARDAGDAGKARFDKLHHRSVMLNGFVLLLLVGLEIAFVARPRSRTQGIVEPTPVQRAILELNKAAATLPKTPADSSKP